MTLENDQGNDNSHYQHNSYNNNERLNMVRPVDTTHVYKAPFPKPFHAPQRQVTVWDNNHQPQQQTHARRASESIQAQTQRYVTSQQLYPYQPMSGIHPLPSSDNMVPHMFIAEPDEDPMQHLVLLPLGKTGAGKSSLLNILLGYDEFKAKAAAKSVTDCITERTGVWTIDQTESIITVADTPGFADSMQRDKEFLSEFQDYVEEVGYRFGVDCFMLVFQYTSSTGNVMATIDHFKSMMEQKFPDNHRWWNHVMFVFTRVDYFPNLKFPANLLSKKQSILESLIPEIQSKYNLIAPPKYAFVSSKAPNCSYNKKGQCDCIAAKKYHLDQMRTLKSRINAIIMDNRGRWVPSV